MPDNSGEHNAFGPTVHVVLAVLLIVLAARLLIPILRTGSL